MHLFAPGTLVAGTLVAGTLVAGTLVTATPVLAAGLGPAASAAGANPSSLLAAAKEAIAKQTAVHLEVKSKSSSSSTTEKVEADLGRRSGAESIMDGTDAVMIVVTPTYGYISGNASGLTKIVGLTAAEVKKVGHDWIALKAGTSQYTSLAADIKVSSVQTVLPAAKGTTLTTQTVTGAHLYVLEWTTAATSSAPKLTSTLTFPVAGTTLPIQETTTASGSKETVTLSKWGEFVNISAPAARDTIPYSKVPG
jgi:hypothetical protein